LFELGVIKLMARVRAYAAFFANCSSSLPACVVRVFVTVQYPGRLARTGCSAAARRNARQDD
jgi:hypothetical protein